MVQLSLILIWLIIKIPNSSNSTSPIKQEIISNPDSPMFNWNNSEPDSEIIFPRVDVFKSRIIPDYSYNLNLCKKCMEENWKLEHGQDLIPESTLEKFSEVITVYFRTPDYTWKENYGQEGYLSICIKHKRQIGFDYAVLN